MKIVPPDEATRREMLQAIRRGSANTFLVERSTGKLFRKIYPNPREFLNVRDLYEIRVHKCPQPFMSYSELDDIINQHIVHYNDVEYTHLKNMIHDIVKAFHAHRKGAYENEIWLSLDEAEKICTSPNIPEMMKEDPEALLVLVLHPENRYAEFTVSKPKEIQNSPFDDFAEDEEFDELIKELLELAERVRDH